MPAGGCHGSPCRRGRACGCDFAAVVVGSRPRRRHGHNRQVEPTDVRDRQRGAPLYVAGLHRDLWHAEWELSSAINGALPSLHPLQQCPDAVLDLLRRQLRHPWHDARRATRWTGLARLYPAASVQRRRSVLAGAEGRDGRHQSCDSVILRPLATLRRRLEKVWARGTPLRLLSAHSITISPTMPWSAWLLPSAPTMPQRRSVTRPAATGTNHHSAVCPG